MATETIYVNSNYELLADTYFCELEHYGKEAANEWHHNARRIARDKLIDMWLDREVDCEHAFEACKNLNLSRYQFGGIFGTSACLAVNVIKVLAEASEAAYAEAMAWGLKKEAEAAAAAAE